MQFVYKFITLPKICHSMRKTFFAIFLFTICVATVCSQTRNVTINVAPLEDNAEPQIYITALVPFTSHNAQPMEAVARGVYKTAVTVSDCGFYQLAVVQGGSQYLTTIYNPGDADVEMTLAIEDRNIMIDDTPHNKALSAYSAVVNANGRRLWNAEPTDDNVLRAILEHYISAADSISSLYDCNAQVSGYIKIWAYTSAYNGLHSANRNAVRVGHELSFKGRDVLTSVSDVLDNDISPLFHESFPMIFEDLKKDAKLNEMFASLHSQYSNVALKSFVQEALIKRFVARHNYNDEYESGLAELTQVVETYNLDKKYIDEYNSHRSMIKGNPFPEGVTLTDVNGNAVPFSTFKGKYVYIDMWASWCGPCRKEIPHLQALEKGLQNDDVVFVSISIDQDEAAWKAKLAEYKMHGNQLLDSGNTLGQALNVRGIPFFVIYDKNGRLYMYGAPRPSMGDSVKQMLEQLH